MIKSISVFSNSLIPKIGNKFSSTKFNLEQKNIIEKNRAYKKFGNSYLTEHVFQLPTENPDIAIKELTNVLKSIIYDKWMPVIPDELIDRTDIVCDVLKTMIINDFGGNIICDYFEDNGKLMIKIYDQESRQELFLSPKNTKIYDDRWIEIINLFIVYRSLNANNYHIISHDYTDIAISDTANSPELAKHETHHIYGTDFISNEAIGDLDNRIKQGAIFDSLPIVKSLEMESGWYHIVDNSLLDVAQYLFKCPVKTIDYHNYIQITNDAKDPERFDVIDNHILKSLRSIQYANVAIRKYGIPLLQMVWTNKKLRTPIYYMKAAIFWAFYEFASHIIAYQSLINIYDNGVFEIPCCDINIAKKIRKKAQEIVDHNLRYFKINLDSNTTQYDIDDLSLIYRYAISQEYPGILSIVIDGTLVADMNFSSITVSQEEFNNTIAHINIENIALTIKQLLLTHLQVCSDDRDPIFQTPFRDLTFGQLRTIIIQPIMNNINHCFELQSFIQLPETINPLTQQLFTSSSITAAIIGNNISNGIIDFIGIKGYFEKLPSPKILSNIDGRIKLTRVNGLITIDIIIDDTDRIFKIINLAQNIRDNNQLSDDYIIKILNIAWQNGIFLSPWGKTLYDLISLIPSLSVDDNVMRFKRIATLSLENFIRFESIDSLIRFAEQYVVD